MQVKPLGGPSVAALPTCRRLPLRARQRSPALVTASADDRSASDSGSTSQSPNPPGATAVPPVANPSTEALLLAKSSGTSTEPTVARSLPATTPAAALLTEISTSTPKRSPEQEAAALTADLLFISGKLAATVARQAVDGVSRWWTNGGRTALQEWGQTMSSSIDEAGERLSEQINSLQRNVKEAAQELNSSLSAAGARTSREIALSAENLGATIQQAAVALEAPPEAKEGDVVAVGEAVKESVDALLAPPEPSGTRSISRDPGSFVDQLLARPGGDAGVVAAQSEDAQQRARLREQQLEAWQQLEAQAERERQEAQREALKAESDRQHARSQPSETSQQAEVQGQAAARAEQAQSQHSTSPAPSRSQGSGTDGNDRERRPATGHVAYLSAPFSSNGSTRPGSSSSVAVKASGGGGAAAGGAASAALATPVPATVPDTENGSGGGSGSGGDSGGGGGGSGGGGGNNGSLGPGNEGFGPHMWLPLLLLALTAVAAYYRREDIVPTWHAFLQALPGGKPSPPPPTTPAKRRWFRKDKPSPAPDPARGRRRGKGAATPAAEPTPIWWQFWRR